MVRALDMRLKGRAGSIRGRYDTIRYVTRCYFNVRSKADMSQLNRTARKQQLKSVKQKKSRQQPWASCSHTHVPVSPSSKVGTGQRAVMLCGWAGNGRSGVALAMRHRLTVVYPPTGSRPKGWR